MSRAADSKENAIITHTTSPPGVSAARADAQAIPFASDEDLAARLSALAKGGQHCAIAATGYTVRLFTRNTADAWTPVCSGDFGTHCLLAVKTLIALKRLVWAQVVDLPVALDGSVPALEPATMSALNSWHARAKNLTVGRGRAISESTRREVIECAAWRCQFYGCGKDLRKHLATGSRGQFSYLAHIVASSADGPRGHALRSHALADEPTNLMLLCDECHRVIDRVAPAKYDELTLQAMRRANIDDVARLLSYLQNDAVDVVRIIGNITGQRPHFYDRDVDEAMWKRKLRSTTGRSQNYFDLGGSLHEPLSAEYWASTFRLFKEDIVRLRSSLYGTDVGGAPRGRLAIFPLHGTSILILAGRIVGDTSGVHLFQPHRNIQSSDSTARWAWPDNEPRPSADKYTVLERRGRGSEPVVTEACLLVSVTFKINPNRLPTPCFGGGCLLLPTLEVSLESPSSDAIRHPDDLALLGAAIDNALRRIQDEWGAKRIHLFVGAPATACFTVGQKMQARNHATFTCHESERHSGTFAQTIEIGACAVRELVSGRSQSIEL